MFSVRWVAHRREEGDSLMEKSLLPNADAVLASCLDRLPLMQDRILVSPPDAFIVFDGNGQEVRRWFGSARPEVTVREAVRAVIALICDRGETLAVTAAIEEFRHRFPDFEFPTPKSSRLLKARFAQQALIWDSMSGSRPRRTLWSAGTTKVGPLSRSLRNPRVTKAAIDSIPAVERGVERKKRHVIGWYECRGLLSGRT
jgi:hypothetical protein